MKKYKWLVSFILLAVSMMILGCSLFGPKNGTTDDKRGGDRAAEVILRLGYGQTVTNPRHLAAQAYAQWVSEQTKGRVKVDLYPTETLGTDKEMTEMVVLGTLDMVITAQGVAAGYEPKLTAIELPFLFASPEKVAQVLDGPIGAELARDLPRSGLRLLAYWDNGFRQITNNLHPITKPADLNGMKIRVPENTLTFRAMRLLGANPIPLPFPEVYIALSRGEVNGQENPIVNIYTARLYEVQKYLTVVNYRYESTPLLISEKTWRKLSPEVQQVLAQGAVRFAAEHRRLNSEMEDRLLTELGEKGMQVTYPDKEAFRVLTQPVYEEWAPLIGRELLERVRRAAQ